MAYMVADMEVDLVANMEVDKVADMAYDITPACHISGRHGGQEDKWPTLRWTWWPTWRWTWWSTLTSTSVFRFGEMRKLETGVG